MGFEVLADLGEVISKEVHDDEVLLTVLDEIIDIADMLEALEVREDVVLEDEDTLVLVLFLYLECHVLFQLGVIGLVNEAKCALTQFLLQVESFGYFQGLLLTTHTDLLNNDALLGLLLLVGGGSSTLTVSKGCWVLVVLVVRTIDVELGIGGLGLLA